MLIFNVIQLITDFPEDGDTCLVVDSINDCPREDVGLDPVELQTAMRRLETDGWRQQSLTLVPNMM